MPGFSQYAKFNQSNSGFKEFKFIKDPDKLDNNTNHIIRTLADDEKKPIDNVSFSFFYTITTQLEQSDTAESLGYISFKGFVITGNVKYMGFPVSDILIPSHASVVIKINNTSNNTINNIDLENIPLEDPITNPPFSISDSVISDDCKIEVSVRKFHFNNEAIILFDNKISTINTYYMNDSILKNAEIKLKKINPGDLDLIPLYNIWIEELDEINDKLNNQDLANELQLELYDPIRFVYRLNSLTLETDNLHSRLKNDLEQMEIIYYEKAKDLLRKNKQEEAEEYLKRSLQFNTKYFPSHYEMAKLHLRRGNPDKAVNIINMIHMSIDINDAEHKMLSELGDNIIQQYLIVAENFILQNKANEALDALNKAEDFCKKTPGVNCPNDIEDLVSRAKYGIYKSYLQVAEKAMEIVSFDFAERYILKASEYQQNNKEIDSDAEIKNLYGKLIYQCTEKGFEALSVPDFNNAQNYFDHAWRLCNSLQGFKCSQRLIDGINSANHGIAMEYESIKNDDYINNETETYIPKNTDNTSKASKQELKLNDHSRLIAEGEILAEAQHTIDAFDKFYEAKKLEKKFNLPSSNKLDTLLSLAAKPVILSDLKKSDFLIWKNKIAEASEIYNKAIDDQKKFNLINDSEINTTLIKLQKNIEEKKCFNAEAEYRNTCLKALRQIRRSRIKEAESALEKANNIKENNSACYFTDDNANQIKKKFSTYFEYQKHMDLARAQARDHKYKKALDHYQKAFNNYSIGDLDTIGLSFPNPDEFIIGYDDPEFSFYACGYLMDKSDYENSFLLLKDLRRLNFPAKETKEIQIKLGKILSEVDMRNDSDSIEKIKEYTLGDKWYQYFRRAYLGTWE